MKKRTTLLVASLLATLCATASVPADTNGDGIVDNCDAQLIYSYILGTADADITLEQVDVNGDGTANTIDVVEVYIAIRNFVEVTDITLNHTTLMLVVNDSTSLTATVMPADATIPSVTWSSNNTSVATVDEKGNVTAIAEGTATITATTANGLTATCTVEVHSDAISGGAPDSDDSEFSAPAQRRGTWGNLWSE